MKKDSLTVFRGSVALLTHWIWTSSLQNCETIHFCCLKPPTLRSFLRQSWGTYIRIRPFEITGNDPQWWDAIRLQSVFISPWVDWPSLSYGNPRQEQMHFGALKTSWTWAFFRKLASLVHTASHFHYYKQCLVADGSVQSRLHIFWSLFLKSSGFWYQFGGTWCWVSPHKWRETVNSVKIGHTRASDRSIELEQGGTVLWGHLCCHPWGKIPTAQVLRVLFPNRKILHCLMHGNLILSKHEIIRIHPEDLLTKFCVYTWEFVIL